MTYAEDILDYLWSISPEGAANGQIARQLGIRSHQTVYMVTQDLRGRGLIRGEQEGRTWVFYSAEAPDDLPRAVTPGVQYARASGSTTSWTAFETIARRLLGELFGTELAPGSVPGVRKLFDYVSSDRQIVGDAKYYTRVGGTRLPPAKFATIAEHVWLLEKTGAPTTFLVFGNDRHVPIRWLERYGNLASTVDFYFLSDTGHLERLTTPVG